MVIWIFKHLYVGHGTSEFDSGTTGGTASEESLAQRFSQEWVFVSSDHEALGQRGTSNTCFRVDVLDTWGFIGSVLHHRRPWGLCHWSSQLYPVGSVPRHLERLRTEGYCGALLGQMAAQTTHPHLE